MNQSIISTKDAPASHTRIKTLDGRIAAALDRAQASTRRVWRTGAHSYRVHSFTLPNVWYALHVTGKGIECGCPAGASRQVCKHAALLSLRLQREGLPTVYASIDFATGELFDEPYPDFTDTTDHTEANAAQQAQWEADMAADELVDALAAEFETDDEPEEPTWLAARQAAPTRLENLFR